MKTPTFDPRRSAQIRAQLQHLSHSSAPTAQQPPRSKASWARPTLTLAGAAAAALLVAGNIQMNAAGAQAESTLKDLAQASIGYQDPQPEPGEYLKIAMRGYWNACTQDEQGHMECARNGVQVRDTYVPADPDDEWVLEMRDTRLPEDAEVIHAADGAFFGTRQGRVEDLISHATGGQELYDYVDGSYDGGSASRNENNFVRLTDALRSGVISAKHRAVFYEALSMVPGVNVTLGVQTADGHEGISIGRTEPLRMGLRAEMIVDPHTGQVIGEREIATLEILGYGMKGEVTGEATFDYSIVDEVPAERLLPGREAPYVEGVDGRDG